MILLLIVILIPTLSDIDTDTDDMSILTQRLPVILMHILIFTLTQLQILTVIHHTNNNSIYNIDTSTNINTNIIDNTNIDTDSYIRINTHNHTVTTRLLSR